MFLSSICHRTTKSLKGRGMGRVWEENRQCNVRKATRFVGETFVYGNDNLCQETSAIHVIYYC